MKSKYDAEDNEHVHKVSELRKASERLSGTTEAHKILEECLQQLGHSTTPKEAAGHMLRADVKLQKENAQLDLELQLWAR